jgi:S1-C subfamily serine protease
MDTTPNNLKQRTVRGAVALGAAALLVAGATWHGFAAEAVNHSLNSPAVSTQAAQTSAVSRSASIAGGRDSYADVVKTVAPAVVTIQVEGRARAVSLAIVSGRARDRGRCRARRSSTGLDPVSW